MTELSSTGVCAERRHGHGGLTSTASDIPEYIAYRVGRVRRPAIRATALNARTSTRASAVYAQPDRPCRQGRAMEARPSLYRDELLSASPTDSIGACSPIQSMRRPLARRPAARAPSRSSRRAGVLVALPATVPLRCTARPTAPRAQQLETVGATRRGTSYCQRRIREISRTRNKAYKNHMHCKRVPTYTYSPGELSGLALDS